MIAARSVSSRTRTRLARFALPVVAVWVAASSVGCGGSNSNPGAGGSACAGSVVLGVWHGNVNGNSDTLTFNSDCTGTASFCQTTFQYPAMTATSGSVMITVLSARSGLLCLTAGQHTCSYAVNGSTLTYSCGGTPLTYTR